MEPDVKRTRFECKSEVCDESTSILLTNNNLAEELLNLENELGVKLCALSFGAPVAYIYNPLSYAADTHCKFVRKYVKGPKKLVFLGMNPGPFGMVQSGVPFGEIDIVKNWLKIDGVVGRPDHEHPKRKVLGLNCARSEVSGARFWGLMKDLSKDPETFFKNAYVHNYCPLAFLNSSGKNITPADFKKGNVFELELLCDEYLLKTLKLLNVEVVVGLGKFTYDKCCKLRKKFPEDFSQIRLERILHPSPMNPATNINGGWKVLALKELEALNLLHLLMGD